MARKIVAQTEGFTKRDAINSRSAETLQKFEGKELNIKGITSCAIMEDVDEETGEPKTIGVLKTAEGEYYTTISETVIDVLDELMDIINEEGAADVRIVKRTSNSNRTFLSLIIL